MRAKKTNKPTRSIRYLLSANPEFQRVSLRKLSEPLKSAKKRPRGNRPTRSAHAKPALILVGIFIATLGVLITARGQSRRADVATAAAPLQSIPRLDTNAQTEAKSKPDKAEAAERRETPKAVALKVADAPATATEKHVADTKTVNTPATDSVKMSVAESTVKSAVITESPLKTPAAELTAKSLAINSTSKTDVEGSAPATITGCLIFDEQSFWLKDATGDPAPKSRSWKWGFLKKRTSNIELVDTSDTLKLPNYVGQRVTATGTLSKREMRAHSLQRVAASCN